MSETHATDPKEVPQLKLTVERSPAAPTAYKLEGWEDLDLWATVNHGLWREIRRRTMGMTESDQLRLLASELLHEAVRLQDRLITRTLLDPGSQIVLRFPDPPETLAKI